MQDKYLDFLYACPMIRRLLIVFLALSFILACAGTGSNVQSDDNEEVDAGDENEEEVVAPEEAQTTFIAGTQSLSFAGHYQHLIAVLDVNADGNDDLLVGGEAGNDDDPSPIMLLVSDGDDGLTDETATYIPNAPSIYSPKGGGADLNGDGVMDVILYDAGNNDDGQHDSSDFGGGFDGATPYLLLSQPNGTWTVSNVLATAALAANTSCADFCEEKSELHIKSFSLGDVDDDGRLDLFIESGGGYRQLYGHFLHQTAALEFTPRSGAPWYDDDIRVGGPQWRWASSALADFDNDGDLDLALGRLARINNDQEDMRNSVVFNNGSGHFLEENRVELAQPDGWNDNWTYVKAIAASDLNDDDLLDMVMVHERSNDASQPESENTGRYVQIFINNGDQTFTDATDDRLVNGDAALVAAHPADDEANYNLPEKMYFADVDADGDQDLVMIQFWAALDAAAPMFYLNNGSGVLTPESTEEFGEFRSRPIAADLNGDDKLDVIVPNVSDNGADEQWGSNDDTTSFTVFLRR